MNGVTEGWMELELLKVVACGRMKTEDEDEVKKEENWEGEKRGGERSYDDVDVGVACWCRCFGIGFEIRYWYRRWVF